MTVLGFTGTEKGLTEAQRNTLARVLTDAKAAGATKLAHGDCIGADSEAALLARRLGLRLIASPGFPVGDPKRQTRVMNDVTFAVKPPLERNRRIARASDRLIACPHQGRETLDSGRWKERRYARSLGGTWATIRYAHQLGKPICIIWPDGEGGLLAWHP